MTSKAAEGLHCEHGILKRERLRGKAIFESQPSQTKKTSHGEAAGATAHLAQSSELPSIFLLPGSSEHLWACPRQQWSFWPSSSLPLCSATCSSAQSLTRSWTQA
nr:protein shisa-like-2A isoform X2 [Rattus norvegicus]